MSISDKLTKIAENVQKVYDAGKAASGGSGGNDLFKGLAEGTLSGEIVDDTITQLRTHAFYGCNKITSLTLNGLSYVNQNDSGHFQGMTALETLNLPLATAIGYSACSGCTSLKNVYAPNAGLSYNSFGNCTSLEIADFPKCNYLNGYTFSGCTSLKIVILRYNARIYLNNVSTFGGTPFRNGEGGTIYVPQDLVEAYKTATNWNALESATFLPIEGSEYE